MRGKRIIVAALALIGSGYVAYPFVTLYQLRTAVRGGDAIALTKLVDWSAVREGIKEDICDLVLDEPADVAKKGQLPAFGASFVRGVTGSSVDREFTPEKLVGMVRPSQPTSDGTRISWAFFTDPKHFTIEVALAGHLVPVKAEMALTDMHWKVMRVWIPSSVLAEGHWTA